MKASAARTPLGFIGNVAPDAWLELYARLVNGAGAFSASAFYPLSQRLLAPGAARTLSALLLDAAGPVSGTMRRLDVGCGPSPARRQPGPVSVGVDVSLRAIAAYGCAGARAVAASADVLPFPSGTFDVVSSVGLLHHLADIRATRAVAEMVRVTRPGGRTVIFDGIRPTAPWRRPVPAALRLLDRGRHHRTAAALVQIVTSSGSWRHQLVTYSANGLEGVVFVREAVRPPA